MRLQVTEKSEFLAAEMTVMRFVTYSSSSSRNSSNIVVIIIPQNSKDKIYQTFVKSRCIVNYLITVQHTYTL